MVDKGAVGKALPPETVHIERGPLSNFAKAVTDANPVYQEVDAATATGFENLPAPPTYSFAMAHWGKFAEDQPAEAEQPNPIMQAIGSLLAQGGLVLHGEQEFVYHRPLVVGDVLTSSGTIKDLYEKEGSGGKQMTFLVTETNWADDTGEPVVTSRMTLIHRA